MGPVVDGRVTELVVELYPQLMRIAYLMVGDQQEAEDLVQDTLIRVHLKRRLVMAADSPHAYVRRILVTQLLSRNRRRTLAVAPYSEDLGTGGNDHSEAKAVSESLHAAMRALPIRQRTAVVLRYYEDLDIPEIAAHMGINESSVRSALTRGREALKSIWVSDPL